MTTPLNMQTALGSAIYGVDDRGVLKVIIWGPRLADQGWSGPREGYNFKKIDIPGNFGVFVLFLVVWPKLPGLSIFLKL